MVVNVLKKFAVTLCSCDDAFQGDNLKKHLENLRAQGISGHNKVTKCYFCAVCGVWGEENVRFPHRECLYVQLAKSDIKEVVHRR